MGLIVCLLFFTVCESFLWIIGFPSRGRDEDPYVGFSGLRPLFTVKNGMACTANNKLRLFNRVSFPVVKSPDTIRIFALGGSTTYGSPYDGRAAFPCI